LAHYIEQRIRGVIFGGLQLSHIVIQFNIYQSISVFIYRDERNFLWHANGFNQIGVFSFVIQLY